MRGKKNLRKIAIILLWILVWAGAAKAVDNRILLVPPVDALKALWSMLQDADFYITVACSLSRISFGFLLGFGTGILLAVMGSRFPLLEEMLAPVMTLLKAVPVASFVVLLLIWWGSSFLAVAICFIVVLPNIYISTMEGFKSTDRQLLQMAKVFRMPVKNRVFYIYRPALEPFLRSSMKISLGMCWKSGVAAEVIGTPDRSIGEGLYLSKIYLDTAGVFAWTAVVILLSVCFEKLALWLAQRFFAWKPACRRPVPLKGSVRDKSVSDRLKTGCDCKNPDGREAVRENREAVCENREIVRGSRKTAPDSEGGGLKVDHVSKAFGSLKVLDDFSAFYQKGQTYVLNGPSGSGKTTLLHILAGILKPDSGGVVRNGSCSMVFQEDRLCMDVSAVKNVEMVTGDDAGAKKALLKLLEPEALDKPCRELSGGMKRRVALVRALEAESDYLLLDEPFTGLDARTRKQAEAYIKERQNGRTLILVTHV